MQTLTRNKTILYIGTIVLTFMFSHILLCAVSEYSPSTMYIESDGHNFGSSQIIHGLAILVLINVLLFIVNPFKYPLYILACSFALVLIFTFIQGEKSGVVTVPTIVASLILYSIVQKKNTTKQTRTVIILQEIIYLLAWVYSYFIISIMFSRDFVFSGFPAQIIDCLFVIIAILHIILQAINCFRIKQQELK